jgi:hypothetical protein
MNGAGTVSPPGRWNGAVKVLDGLNGRAHVPLK